MRVRSPAVAGMFYPGDATVLRKDVRRYLEEGRRTTDIHGAPLPDTEPAALIAPHAGYPYSGPVAGTAYASLAGSADRVRRVLLLGPAHHVSFAGLAVPTDDAWATPLGRIAVDAAWRAAALELDGVQAYDTAHAPEHSLEVQLPFLQTVLADATVLPILVGAASEHAVADVLDALWPRREDDILVVVSSDLSHYLDYDAALEQDARTARFVETLRPVGERDACGRLPINGLLLVAGLRKMRARTLDLRSSGDTAGPRDRVVGYGAFAFHPAAA